jgi:hypothetical protein
MSRKFELIRGYLVFLLALFAAGCAKDVVIRMPSQAAPATSAGATLVNVTVLDTRRPGVAASKRESLGTPMGNITFEPSEAELVKRDLEVELSRRMAAKGLTQKESFSAVIEEFGVNTESTALYWDVNARISLVLKHGARDFPLNGTGTERTYVWPGEEVIQRSVDAAMQQINAGLDPVVASLQP